MRILSQFAVGLLFLFFVSQFALAQQMPGNGPGPGAEKTLTPEQFQERKARVLKMIEERRSRLDQAKACVEQANNIEELRKCRPERPVGMMGRGGPGRQRGPMPLSEAQ